jgi:uncharacterized repeat protein (TIGR03803 family)
MFMEILGWRRLHMGGKRLSVGLRTVLAIFAVTLFVTSTWAQTHENVLYSFINPPDGVYPSGGLIFDAAGNLYGMTQGGGTYNHGTVFELTPTAGGGWTETVLYNFGNPPDGVYPSGGPVGRR